jgi:hypothetical protein
LTTEFANDRVGFLYPKTTSTYPYQNFYAIFKLFTGASTQVEEYTEIFRLEPQELKSFEVTSYAR